MMKFLEYSTDFGDTKDGVIDFKAELYFKATNVFQSIKDYSRSFPISI
jgi:hypothetical protein